MSGNQVIPLSRPDISPDDIRAVTEVLRSGRLSYGPAMDAFEDMLAARVGRSEGVAVSSGTAGTTLRARHHDKLAETSCVHCSRGEASTNSSQKLRSIWVRS